MSERLAVALETSPKKAFAAALEWPGWARSGKTDELAIEALLTYASRYEPIVRAANLRLPRSFDVEVVERLDGSAGTEFGIPSQPTRADARPVDAAGAKRLASIVEASWTTFDGVVAGAPAELRKGPRGGGRDRDKMADHVIGADWYYAREIGIKVKEPGWTDRPAIEALRAAVLAVLRQPSDGSPLAGRKWPARYAARRIAWHALDHAWEIEDRSESDHADRPVGGVT
jgi:hypothetical protein